MKKILSLILIFGYVHVQTSNITLLRDPNVQSNTLPAIKSIKSLMIEGLITSQQALPLLEREMDDSNPNVQKNTLLKIENLIDEKLITSQQALPLLEKGANDSNPDVQFKALSIIENVMKKQLIRLEFVLSLLKEGMNYSDPKFLVQLNSEILFTINVIKFLVNKKIITKEQTSPLLEKTLPFFEKGINNNSMFIESDITSTFEILINKTRKSITFP